MPEETKPTEEAKAEDSPYDLTDAADDAGEAPVEKTKTEAKGDEEASHDGDESAKPKDMTWPAHLLRRALESGLDADDAKEYETPKALAKALDLMDRQLAKKAREGGKEKKPEPEPTAAEIKQKYSERLKARDPGHWDDLFLELIDEITEGHAKEMEELRGGLGQLAQAEQTRQAEAYFDRIDTWFRDLGDERLGTDRRGSLKPDSPVMKARVSMLRLIEAEAASLRSAGQQIPSDEELLEKVYADVYGAKPKTETKTEPNGKAKPGRELTARPTQRQATAPVKGDKYAREQLALKMREKGMLDDQDDNELDEIFG